MDINITGQDIISFAQSLWILTTNLIAELIKQGSSFALLLSSSLKDNPPVTLFAFSVLGSIATWGYNEHAKRSNERHLRKIERYVELIDLIENLMDTENKKPGDPDLRTKFIHQINLCLLYCSDEVVKKAIDLVSKFNDDEISEKDKDRALSELMITLRKDVLKMSTKLKPEDYEKIRPAMLRRFVLKAARGEVNLTLGELKSTATGKVAPPPSQEEAKKKGWWRFWK